MTDGELLSKYADEACEESFRRLVDRYLSLVQGVTVRKTGRSEWAEDIAMQVFAQAARKAHALSRRVSLGGWFVLAARLAAAQAVRREHSRIRVMEKIAQQSPALHSEDSACSWSGALPWLDDALARLSERERDAVVLHFYNGMSFREIGRREGRGEDASRKRVGLALGKMSRFFQRRGITLSITAVSSALTSEWAHSQTATAAAAVAQKALALAPSLSASQVAGSSLTTVSIAKALSTAALITVCLVPLVGQFQDISATRNRIDALERIPRSLFRSPTPVTVVARKVPESPVPAPVTEEPRKEIDLAALAGDFLAAKKDGDIAARRRVRLILEPLDADRLLSLLESASTLGFPKDTADSIINGLLDELVSKHPEHAAKQSARFGCAFQLRDGLSLWTKSNPAAALAWYMEQRANGAFKDEGLHTYPNVAHEATKGLMASLFEADPGAAQTMLETLSPGDATSVLSALAENPDNTKFGYDELAAMAARLSSSQKAAVLKAPIMRMAKGDRDNAATLIRSAGLNEKEQISLLIHAASQGPVEEKSLTERLAWIVEQTGLTDTAGLQGKVLAQSLGRGDYPGPPDAGKIETVFKIVQRLSAGNGGSDLVASFLNNSSPIVLRPRPHDWFAMAASLPAGRSRDEHLKDAIEAWSARDPAAAAAAMAALKTSPKPSAEQRGKR